MKREAQGFDQFPLLNASNEEEQQYLKTVTVIPLSNINSNDKKEMNIIGSHTLYKIKQNDDDSMKMKGRIVPHGHSTIL